MISHIYKRYNINSRQEIKKHETIKKYLLRGGKIIKLPAKLPSDVVKYTRPKGTTVNRGIVHSPVMGFFA